MSFSQTPGYVAPAPQQLTPGDIISDVQGVRGIQAQNAQAQAYKAAIDPNTGVFDQGRFNALMGQSGTWNIGAAMQQAGQAQQATAQGSMASVNAAQTQLTSMNGWLRDLTMNPGPISAGQIQTKLDQLRGVGAITPGFYQQAQGVLAKLAPGEDARPLVQSMLWSNQQAQQQLESMYPNIQLTNMGGTMVPVQTGRYYGGQGTPVGPGIARTPSPEFQNQPVDVPIGGGQVIKNVPYNVAQAIQRDPSLLPYFYPNARGAAPPVTNNSFGPNYTGTYPGGNPPGAPAAPGTAPRTPVTQTPLPTPPSAQPPAPAVAPTATPAPPAATGSPAWLLPPPPAPTGGVYGGVGITASPEVSAQQTAQGTQSQAQLTSLQQQVQMVPQTRALLSDMRSEEATPGFQGGIGAQTASTFNKVLQFAHLGDQGNYDFTTPQQAREAFKKDSSLLAQTQLKALGNSSAITDARQELTEASTPTVEMSDAGRRLLIHTLSGNQTAVQVMNDSWTRAQRAGWGPAQFSQWMQSFNATDPRTGGQFDPRVFWLADMTPQEQWDYGHKMMGGSNADAMQFSRNLDYAERMGWISVNNTGNIALAQAGG